MISILNLVIFLNWVAVKTMKMNRSSILGIYEIAKEASQVTSKNML